MGSNEIFESPYFFIAAGGTGCSFCTHDTIVCSVVMQAPDERNWPLAFVEISEFSGPAADVVQERFPQYRPAPRTPRAKPGDMVWANHCTICNERLADALLHTTADGVFRIFSEDMHGLTIERINLPIRLVSAQLPIEWPQKFFDDAPVAGD